MLLLFAVDSKMQYTEHKHKNKAKTLKWNAHSLKQTKTLKQINKQTKTEQKSVKQEKM